MRAFASGTHARARRAPTTTAAAVAGDASFHASCGCGCCFGTGMMQRSCLLNHCFDQISVTSSRHVLQRGFLLWVTHSDDAPSVAHRVQSPPLPLTRARVQLWTRLGSWATTSGVCCAAAACCLAPSLGRLRCMLQWFMQRHVCCLTLAPFLFQAVPSLPNARAARLCLPTNVRCSCACGGGGGDEC